MNSTLTKKQQHAIIETRLRKISFRTQQLQQRDQKKKIAGNLLVSHKKKLPPSPPSRKRKAVYEEEDYNNRNKRCQYMDNLTLLATQATQLRGLPLSPEVSPSPPPLVLNSINHRSTNYRLPSLQTMLSGLYK
jgi:hypothetical protein